MRTLSSKATPLGLLRIFVASSLIVLAAWGCGKSPTSYHNPNTDITTTATPTALIDAATLKQWVDEGKVNNNTRGVRDRVVILTVATAAQYAAGHIPGAQLYNSGTDLSGTREEALGVLTSEPPDGATMDAIIQRLGIDANTTIVFTGTTGQNFLNPSRAYFTFRYWGFPRARLKVLQGGEAAWTAAGQSLVTAAPSVTPSTFSVKDCYDGTGASFAMRAPIGEMIDVIDKFNTGALSTTDPNGIVVLDVRGGTITYSMANSKIDDYNQYSVTGSNATFKPTADLVARLATFGVTSSTRLTYVYCASGQRASSVFFVLDGVLGWPVRLYDGSSGQWSQYVTANGVGTAWRVDTNTPTTILPRTTGTITAGSFVLNPVNNVLFSSITDPRANQVAKDDKGYASSGSTAGGGGGGGGGGGAPSGC